MSNNLISRLGFEEYAFNLLINEIENGNLYDGYKAEHDNGSMSILSVGDTFLVAVRTYIPSNGWMSTEFNYKPTR
jgi:hypothetical protein